MGKRAKAGFFGVLIGAILGVFALAPKSAKENRKDAAKKAREVKASTEKTLKKIDAELEKDLKVIKAKAKQATGKAKTELAEWQKMAEDMKNKIMKALDKEDKTDPETVVGKAKAFAKDLADKLKD